MLYVMKWQIGYLDFKGESASLIFTIDIRSSFKASFTENELGINIDGIQVYPVSALQKFSNFLLEVDMPRTFPGKSNGPIAQ
ncbi:hypothetical protein D3C87_1605800 [compost metagenome]